MIICRQRFIPVIHRVIEVENIKFIKLFQEWGCYKVVQLLQLPNVVLLSYTGILSELIEASMREDRMDEWINKWNKFVKFHIRSINTRQFYTPN